MAQQFLYGTLLISYSTAVLLLLNHMWSRRHLQPLKVREPYLMVISVLSGLLLVAMISFREINVDKFPCSVYVWIACLFPPGFFLPYFLRTLRLNFIYTLNKEMANSSDVSERQRRRRKWVTKGTLLFVFSVVMMIHIVLAFFTDMYVENTKDEEGEYHEGCVFVYEFIPLLAVSVLYVLLYIYCLFCLKNLFDNFGIKKELLRCTLLWLPCLTLFFLCNLWEPLFWINDWFATSTYVVIMLIGSLIFSILIPLLQTYTSEGQKSGHEFRSMSIKNFCTVDQVLNDNTNIAREELMNYLVQCFEPNGLRFIMDVDAYKKMNVTERNLKAFNIKERYLEEHSEMELKQLTKYTQDEGRHIITRIMNNFFKGKTNKTDDGKPNEYQAVNLFDEAYEFTMRDIDNRFMEGFVLSENYQRLCEKMGHHSGIVTGFEDNDIL